MSRKAQNKNNKMEKSNFMTKLYKCCSKDKEDARQWPKAVHFRNGFAYASEGHVLVKSSLDNHSIISPENLEGKSIHRDNFKEIMKFEFAECVDDGVSCKNTDGQIAFYEYMDLNGEAIPDFDKVIPPIGEKLSNINQIGVRPKYVEMLASAMFSDEDVYRYRFTGANTAIVVDAVGFPGQIGIIMPAALSDSIFE